MVTFLLLLGECQVQLEHFNLRFLSCEYQRQADLSPASSFAFIFKFDCIVTSKISEKEKHVAC